MPTVKDSSGLVKLGKGAFASVFLARQVSMQRLVALKASADKGDEPQMLAQLGAFALPALLPGYIARWDLSKIEAGWLVGIFFAAYVAAVPVLLALTDRLPVRRYRREFSWQKPSR